MNFLYSQWLYYVFICLWMKQRRLLRSIKEKAYYFSWLRLFIISIDMSFGVNRFHPESHSVFICLWSKCWRLFKCILQDVGVFISWPIMIVLWDKWFSFWMAILCFYMSMVETLKALWDASRRKHATLQGLSVFISWCIGITKSCGENFLHSEYHSCVFICLWLKH
jgi:hypothetical protein